MAINRKEPASIKMTTAEALVVAVPKRLQAKEFTEFGFKAKMTAAEFKKSMDALSASLSLDDKFLASIGEDAQNLQAKVKRYGMRHGKPDRHVTHAIDELRAAIADAASDAEITGGKKISASELVAIQEVIAYGQIEEGLNRRREARLSSVPKGDMKAALAKAADQPVKEKKMILADSGADAGYDDLSPSTLPVNPGTGPKRGAPMGRKQRSGIAA